MLTQVPGWERRCGGGARLLRTAAAAAAQDGAVRLVVDHVGQVAPLLVLGRALTRTRTGLEVGVAAGSVAADRALVPAMRAGLDEG